MRVILRYLSFLFVGLLLLLAFSCSSQKSLNSLITTTKKDSTSVRRIYKERDTTIYIAGDVTTLKIPSYRITEQPIYQYGKRSTLSLQRKGDTIIGRCNVDSLKYEIKLRDKTIELYKQFNQQGKETKEIAVKYTPKWKQFFVYIGIFAAGILIIKLLRKFTF